MPRVLYSVGLGPGTDVISQSAFEDKIKATLSDPRGWRKYGYEFIKTACRQPVLHIHMEAAENAAQQCGMEGFSCWRDEPNDIIINLKNWMGGSKSELPLERYRTYVILHEVGHALGLDHQSCPIKECTRRGMDTCPGPVMMQMTRGPKHIAPCVENEWPLDPDWKIEDPRIARQYLAMVIICVIVLILLVCVSMAGSFVQMRNGVMRSQFKSA